MQIAADTADDKGRELQTKAAAALDKGLAYLTRAQGKDGGWHSQTYGQLKGGAALTTFVLDALSHAPAEWRNKQMESITRGFEFLRAGIAKRGTIACPDGSLDHPTYGAALWLLSRRRLELAGEERARADLVTYLLGAQCVEERGFEKESPSYGGWDFLGQGDAHGVTTGTNVSVTCLVLEALAEEFRREPGGKQIGEIQAALSRGLAWTNLCQQKDGGYCFTPEPMSLNNKADFRDDARHVPRAYGTATCDGIRALLAAGMKADDKRVVKAAAWLAARLSLELVPGFEGLPPELGWQRGLRFYYYASLAKVLPTLPTADVASRRKGLLEMLLKLQRTDGSFLNESDRMRENDPLIATGLGGTALAELLDQLQA
ncbi:MAG: prenyltransferase/squalene oxidase repeat-containing protein [Pirellulaceae bacterium]